MSDPLTPEGRAPTVPSYYGPNAKVECVIVDDEEGKS